MARPASRACATRTLGRAEGSSQTILRARRALTMKLWSSDARSEGQPGYSLLGRRGDFKPSLGARDEDEPGLTVSPCPTLCDGKTLLSSSCSHQKKGLFDERQPGTVNHFYRPWLAWFWRIRPLHCMDAIGFSTMSPFIGPSAPSNSLFSRSGTLNLLSVATRSPTSESKSLLLTPMPEWVAFILRPV